MDISLAIRIDAGAHISFNLERQSIQIFQGKGLLNPLPWSKSSNDWTCLLLKDEDSCMHIAGLIAALTGLVLGESQKTSFGIVFPLLQQSS